MIDYSASNIRVLNSQEVLEKMPWIEPEILATKYNKDVEFIKRGLLACRNAGVSDSYFIDRYLEGNKDIPHNKDVEYQSKLLQGCMKET